MTDNNGAGAAPTLTLGAAAKRLRENGYQPLSALHPSAFVVGPAVGFVEPDAALLSEHPAAVRISALILEPIADEELAERVRAVLDQHGLLDGPARRGSDDVAIRPINLGGRLRSAPSELGGAVRLVESVVLALDGCWSESLLEIPAADLPTIEPDDVRVVFERELRYLAAHLAQERAPPRKPSPRGFIGR
jgi:hypothetical protein